jgi:pimeloyl-ACP methyl ester carboxylesterase
MFSIFLWKQRSWIDCAILFSNLAKYPVNRSFHQTMKPAMGIPESYPLSEAEQLQGLGSIRSVLPI